MRTLILRSIAAAAVLVLSACGGGVDYHGGGGGGGGGGPYPRPNPQPYPPTMSCSATGLAAAAQSTYPTVCMLTSSGEMVIELYPSYAPVTVNNFLRYVADGFYSNTLFHHVDRDFVVQAGGYTSGMRVRTPTYAPIVSESNNGLSNLVGTVAMARRSDPNSATSQFFINVVDNSRTLDYESAAKPGYAVFGRVISGMSTVYAINGQPTYYYSASDIEPQQEVLVYWVQRVR